MSPQSRTANIQRPSIAFPDAVITVRTKSDLRRQLSPWRSADERIAVVPTMGNLHEGHLSLIRVASAKADRVVATIFVNPTQFSGDEDFDDYPRSLRQDEDRLAGEGVDVLFAPDMATVYPFGLDYATRISVPILTDQLCGLGRPGHFDGVTSVVMRLFAIVQPDLAIFGQKDFQQQLVIGRMVADIGMPIEIVTAPVVREKSGLAMSSRNTYLEDEQREVAASIYRALQDTSDKLQVNANGFDDLETQALRKIERSGLRPEYFAIRNSENLERPGSTCKNFVVLAAAHLGSVRLIDNVLIKTK